MFLVYFLLLLVPIRNVEGKVKKVLDGDLTNVTWHLNPKYANGSLTIRKIKTEYYIDGDLYTFQTLKDVYGTFTLQLKLTNNPKYQTIIKVSKLDCCGFLNGTVKENILKTVHKEFMKFSNFSLTCPVLPNYYYVRNLTADKKKIPPIFVPGEYKLIIEGFKKTKNDVFEPLFGSTWYGWVTIHNKE